MKSRKWLCEILIGEVAGYSKGASLFWPLYRPCPIRPAPAFIRVETGGRAEPVFFWRCVMATNDELREKAELLGRIVECEKWLEENASVENDLEGRSKLPTAIRSDY